MCRYLQTEVILANYLLNKEDGVSKKDLINYCRIVKSLVNNYSNFKNESIFFDVSDESLEKAVRVYRDIFYEKGRMIFKRNDININYFNSRLDKELVSAFMNAAEDHTEIQNKVS